MVQQANNKRVGKGNCLDDIEMKLKLSVLKPLHASWLTEAYNYFTSETGRKIIANGWKSAGITETVSKGIEGLPLLDPFDSFDPLIQFSIRRLFPISGG